jgi:hypothetical protein
MTLQGRFLKTVRLEEGLVMKVSMKKLFLYSDINFSESESNDEEESSDNMQPVTRSWKIYRDGDLPEFLYSVTQQGFTLPQGARPKLNLNISRAM